MRLDEPASYPDRELPNGMLPTYTTLHPPVTPAPEGSGQRSQTQATGECKHQISEGCQTVMGVWHRLHNPAPGSISWQHERAAGRRHSDRRAGRESANRRHADRRDPWNAGQGLFQGERARPTVRGKAALHQSFHRGEPNRSSAMIVSHRHGFGASGQYIRPYTGRDPGRRFLHRVTREMGVAGGRLDLGVPQ